DLGAVAPSRRVEEMAMRDRRGHLDAAHRSLPRLARAEPRFRCMLIGKEPIKKAHRDHRREHRHDEHRDERAPSLANHGVPPAPSVSLDPDSLAALSTGAGAKRPAPGSRTIRRKTTSPVGVLSACGSDVTSLSDGRIAASGASRARRISTASGRSSALQLSDHTLPSKYRSAK